MNLALRTSPSGVRSELNASLASYGAQPAWAINPTLGNDNNTGTPLAPLATMAELSARLSAQLIRQATTVSIVGSVTDSALLLSGVRFASGASLAFAGTRTVLVSGVTISVVQLSGFAFPWQITTAGIDWTSQPKGSQIRFSNATVSPIIEVIDANNVVVGQAAVLPFV